MTPLSKRTAALLGLLATAVVAAGGSLLLRPPALPGALGVVAYRVRPGDSLVAAIASVRAAGSDNVDCLSTRGTAVGDRPFSGMGIALDALPGANEIESAELEVLDEDGRELVIGLGRGGVVTGVQLWSRVWLEGWRYSLWR